MRCVFAGPPRNHESLTSKSVEKSLRRWKVEGPEKAAVLLFGAMRILCSRFVSRSSVSRLRNPLVRGCGHGFVQPVENGVIVALFRGEAQGLYVLHADFARLRLALQNCHYFSDVL